jgi:hypothetical protein
MTAARHNLRKKLGRITAVLFATSLFLQVACLPMHSFAQQQKIEKSLLTNVDELDSQDPDDAPGKLPSFYSTFESHSLQFKADPQEQKHAKQILDQGPRIKPSVYILFRALLL